MDAPVLNPHIRCTLEGSGCSFKSMLFVCMQMKMAMISFYSPLITKHLSSNVLYIIGHLPEVIFLITCAYYYYFISLIVKKFICIPYHISSEFT